MFTASGPSTFKGSSRADRVGLVLCEFACAEFASAVEILQAAKLTDNAELSRGFIRHALDEYRHAGLFADLSSAVPGETAAGARRARFVPRNAPVLGYLDTRRFLAEKYDPLAFAVFVGVNEKAAYGHFAGLRRRLAEVAPALGAGIDGILEDEERHARHAFAFAAGHPAFKVRLLGWRERGMHLLRRVYAGNRWLGEVAARLVLGLAVALITPLRFAFAVSEGTGRDGNQMSRAVGRSMI